MIFEYRSKINDKFGFLWTLKCQNYQGRIQLISVSLKEDLKNLKNLKRNFFKDSKSFFLVFCWHFYRRIISRCMQITYVNLIIFAQGDTSKKLLNHQIFNDGSKTNIEMVKTYRGPKYGIFIIKTKSKSLRQELNIAYSLLFTLTLLKLKFSFEVLEVRLYYPLVSDSFLRIMLISR